jgi:hypothetical protein
MKQVASRDKPTSVDFQRLHGVISQKIELFRTTAVRTSNPAFLYVYIIYGKFALQMVNNAVWIA